MGKTIDDFHFRRAPKDSCGTCAHNGGLGSKCELHGDVWNLIHILEPTGYWNWWDVICDDFKKVDK